MALDVILPNELYNATSILNQVIDKWAVYANIHDFNNNINMITLPYFNIIPDMKQRNYYIDSLLREIDNTIDSNIRTYCKACVMDHLNDLKYFLTSDNIEKKVIEAINNFCLKHYNLYE
ncbi:hypothetical protein NEOKW01_0394 [Nematocida sp. AWRm80]|nr:hypothetical protein NEOKW01_0394 [Nematocida sp. AWRm80]